MKKIITILLLVGNLAFATEWTTVSSGSAENLNDIIFNSSTSAVIVGTNGTILKSDNTGFSWSPASVSHTIEIRAVDFMDNNNGFAIGQPATDNSSGFNKFYSELLTTDDGGLSWSKDTIREVNAYDLQVVNASTLYTSGFPTLEPPGFCTTPTCPFKTLLRSQDAGANWSRVDARANNTTVNGIYGIDFFSAEVGYAVGEGGRIVKTTDTGVTWTDVSPAGSPGRVFNKIKFPIEATGYAVSTEGDSGAVWRSTNSGQTWTKILAAPHPLKNLYFSSTNSGIVVGDSGTIFTTFNGGGEWDQDTLPNNEKTNLSAVAFANDSLGFIVGSEGKIYTSIINLSSNSTAPDLEIDYTYSGPNTICENTTITFTNISNGANSSSYKWYINNSLVSTEQDLTYTFTNLLLEGDSSKNITILLTGDSAGLTTDSSMQDITLIARPVANFTISPDPAITGEPVVFTSTSSFAKDYKWSIDEISVSEEATFSNTFFNEDTLTIELTVSNDFCPDSTISRNLVIRDSATNTNTTGISLTNNHQFSISPNPNNGQFSIAYEKSILYEEAFLTIYNIWGTLVFEKKIATQSMIENLDIELPSGIYNVRLSSNKISAPVKLIIQ